MRHRRTRRASAVARHLADAQRDAGLQAVAAAELGDHVHAYQWQELAVELSRLTRGAVELLAAGAERRECAGV